MDQENIKYILQGKVVPLPAESSNTVRLFISSTFSDMAEERDALMEIAYPEIQTFCQKHGLTFEVVDMRWGVRDYASVDHMTTDLCLKEIEACKKTSIGPYFIGLVGNRYGYRPMPRLIGEEEFNILYKKVLKNEAEAQLLTHWYWKDINAVPPMYVFQPITVHLPHFSDNNPSHAELQLKEIKKWRESEKRISQALRLAAENAQKEGLITLEQKHKYFKSVTEWEIECGLLASDTDEAGSTMFFREVKDINLCKDGLQILDVKEDGSHDSEAQDLLEELKSRIVQKHQNKVKTLTVELSKQALKANYLQMLCDQVIAVVNHQILRCLSTREKDISELQKKHPWLGGLMQEVTHHLQLSHTKSEVFCGRQEILETIVSRIKNSEACVQAPLVIYGASGSGKTALMCKTFELLRQSATADGHHVLVLRLLGTSPQSSEIHDVLKSICYQVCLALDLPFPTTQVTNIYNETVRFFHQILTKVSNKRSENLVLFLDSLDQLSSSEGAHHLHWLPKECPANVHIVLSTLPNEASILNTLRGKITDVTSYLEVQPLSAEQGGQVIEKLMSSTGRKLTPAQLDIVLDSFRKCGQPLLLKLAFDEAKRWSSYTPPSQLHIATSTKEAVYQLYQRIENVHGKLLVSHALGYIAACRTGLSEAELKDILSLDDEVLADIYQYWAPPRSDVIRIPVLSWTHLRHDLDGYLVERQADGSTVLGLYHRQFIEVAQEIYLNDSERKKRHHTLAEYFLGTWSMGTLRWINLPLLNKSLSADRKVAPQPLWFSEDMPNLRKMNELPYHLLNAGNIDELQREILGNMNWISSKIVACGINSLIQDFDMCVKRINNGEVKLVHDTLRLFQPTINFIEARIDPCIIYVEMLARLHFFKLSCPSLIGNLCQQCFTWFEQYPNPTFIPVSGFFQPPGGPLQTTLTGFKKGITVMEVCPYKDLVVVASDDGTMIVWDIKDIVVIHTLNGHSAGILCVKVFGQGTRVVSGSLDNTLVLWNLVTGKQYLTIQEDHTIYENAYLDVDEKNGIIYSAAGSQVCGWNIESGDPVLCFSPGVPGFPLQAAVFSPQQTVMTVTEGGTVHIWESTTGQLKGSRQIPGADAETTHPVCSCVIPKYGKMVVGFKNGFLALISTGGGVSAEKMPCIPNFVVVSDEESLFAAGFGKQVQVFRADSNTLRTFLGSCLEHDDMVKTAVIHSQKNIIVTGSQDETIRVWSLSKRGALLDTFFGMGVSVTGLAMNGSTLISSSNSAYYLKLWNLDYDQKHKTLPPFQDRSGCVALSSGGDRVYFPKTGDKHKIVVWDTVQGLMTDILEASSEVTCLEVAKTKKILFCGLNSGTVLAFPLDQRQNVACIPPPEHNVAVICLSISKQESFLAVAHHDMILLYEVTKGDPIPMLDGPVHSINLQIPSAVSKVAIFEDQRVIYGTEKGDMCLFNPKKEEQCLDSHASRVTCLETSTKEIYALSGCEDSVERLWNMETGCWEHEMCYKGFFFQGVDCACFSPDDCYIYTGSKDRAIKAWDVSTGSLLAVQYVYATVTRIVSTSDGFIATTRLGYVIREKFQCPETISTQYNPLQNIKATCTVKSKKSKDVYNKTIQLKAKSTNKWWRCKEQANKNSQICHIV
ncbi:PREDICTED: NACHT domain- and WD repeat-containing protein 1 [Nanorana parkeri]|uniref:NACHT domain- and WD repeat-containing protein 1 n=1 Tax=Nanorana parkeri TaxID=125878 RepID=UPI000853FF25|nr:PREDICTED: NACHT domain- and WD repeat-containing protein 1 [Nanorana parkeri]